MVDPRALFTKLQQSIIFVCRNEVKIIKTSWHSFHLLWPLKSWWELVCFFGATTCNHFTPNFVHSVRVYGCIEKWYIMNMFHVCSFSASQLIFFLLLLFYLILLYFYKRRYNIVKIQARMMCLLSTTRRKSKQQKFKIDYQTMNPWCITQNNLVVWLCILPF